MCLAVPAKIIKINESALTCTANVNGATTEASLILTPEAKVDDYVLIHAGYTINIIDEEEALKTIEIFKEIEKMNSGTLTKEA
ncbi:MAG: HypC/HybG/HupF family hydrogenase formation chaperone [Chloroflexi bacterium]|nr:HypC/HybG/HupF family hydrogenase formation chaperone [Chloroflexota bacterium]